MRSTVAWLAGALLAACSTNHAEGPPPPDSAQAAAFLDTVETRTFHYFWDLTNTANGLVPDRSPTPSFSSIAAVGFGLTAYPIGARADWQWFSPRPPVVSLGWHPESGFLAYDWRGYSEAMIVYILALGSPTHPVDTAAWSQWTGPYQWATFYGQTHLGFAPLFGHQYSHVWIDFHGIQDPYMKAHGIDHFDN